MKSKKTTLVGNYFSFIIQFFLFLFPFSMFLSGPMNGYEIIWMTPYSLRGFRTESIITFVYGISLIGTLIVAFVAIFIDFKKIFIPYAILFLIGLGFVMFSHHVRCGAHVWVVYLALLTVFSYCRNVNMRNRKIIAVTTGNCGQKHS